MHKRYLLTGALSGAAAVALGAFGAHGLRQMVAPETVNTFQTGVQYQMYHTLALLAAGVVYERYSNQYIKWAGFCFILGIVLFSGSLYILTALKATATAGFDGVGIVTPVGGLFFIAGWLFLFAGIMKKN